MHGQLVTLLCKYGADPAITNKANHTPATIATLNKEEDITEVLQSAKVDVNADADADANVHGNDDDHEDEPVAIPGPESIQKVDSSMYTK